MGLLSSWTTPSTSAYNYRLSFSLKMEKNKQLCRGMDVKSCESRGISKQSQD